MPMPGLGAEPACPLEQLEWPPRTANVSAIERCLAPLAVAALGAVVTLSLLVGQWVAYTRSTAPLDGHSGHVRVPVDTMTIRLDRKRGLARHRACSLTACHVRSGWIWRSADRDQ
jgi:hypothetical protein